MSRLSPVAMATFHLEWTPSTNFSFTGSKTKLLKNWPIAKHFLEMMSLWHHWSANMAKLYFQMPY